MEARALTTQRDPIELLQALIRNACVNDGTPQSGQEVRNADTLAAYLGTSGIETEVFEAAPGRVSLVARITGAQPGAPALCLMGHTDVVPVNPAGWDRDPFGGELVDGEVWGRGAVDMLNLTSTMAVAFRDLARTGFRPRGDVIFFAVADEESGSGYGAHWMADHHWDAIGADFVLTEGGGLHGGTAQAPVVTVSVAEKGVSWRRLRVTGEPGHGSMPFRTNNALVKAAAVVSGSPTTRPEHGCTSSGGRKLRRSTSTTRRSACCSMPAPSTTRWRRWMTRVSRVICTRVATPPSRAM